MEKRRGKEEVPGKITVVIAKDSVVKSYRGEKRELRSDLTQRRLFIEGP